MDLKLIFAVRVEKYFLIIQSLTGTVKVVKNVETLNVEITSDVKIVLEIVCLYLIILFFAVNNIVCVVMCTRLHFLAALPNMLRFYKFNINVQH